VTDYEISARRGCDSSFPDFCETPSRLVRVKLEDFIKDASGSQVRA
jgi:hypothetical protein